MRARADGDLGALALESARNPLPVDEHPRLMTEQTLRVAMACAKVAAERGEYLPSLCALESKYGIR